MNKGTRWYDKVSWNRTRNIASMVGFTTEEIAAVQGMPTDDKEFYMIRLLDHIWLKMNKWEPPMKWEDFPDEVRVWYTEAEPLEAMEISEQLITEKYGLKGMGSFGQV